MSFFLRFDSGDPKMFGTYKTFPINLKYGIDIGNLARDLNLKSRNNFEILADFY